jgi:hypothetical protein
MNTGSKVPQIRSNIPGPRNNPDLGFACEFYPAPGATEQFAAAEPAGVQKDGACLASQNIREGSGDCQSRRAAELETGKSLTREGTP